MKSRSTAKTVLLWLCLTGLPVASFWLGGEYVEGTYIVKKHGTISRFAQLKLALHMYHEDFGVFPPIKYQPVPGGPTHSWRVLLAPYVGGGLSNTNYDFTQEWNSPSNLQAFSRMPGNYEMHPAWGSGMQVQGHITHYFAIGKDDDWPFSFPLKSRVVKKGTDQFWIVEDPESEIHWMEPKN